MRELSEAWARVQVDQRIDLLDDIGATWWRVHKLASTIGEPWALDLDAVLLETTGMARHAYGSKPEAGE